jgi:hypothetical protein
MTEKNETTYLSCFIDREMKHEIDELASASERNTSQMVRLLLSYGLTQYKKREAELCQD